MFESMCCLLFFYTVHFCVHFFKAQLLAHSILACKHALTWYFSESKHPSSDNSSIVVANQYVLLFGTGVG